MLFNSLGRQVTGKKYKADTKEERKHISDHSLLPSLKLEANTKIP